MINPDKLKDYHARYVRWADESLKQLSFYNNLLLTLSVGFLSFSFNKYTFHGIRFTYTSVDCSLTFLVSSVMFITISILLGLFVAINRLQDFRVTRKINLARYRMYEHLKKPLDENTPDKFNFWKRLTLAFHNYPTIQIEEYKKYKGAGEETEDKRKAIETIRFKFRELRNIAHNLGRTTWKLTVWQTVYFAIGIALYMWSILAS